MFETNVCHIPRKCKQDLTCFNERTCCDRMLITLGNNDQLFLFTTYVKYSFFFTVIQSEWKETIHGLSPLVNDRKKGSGC